ncbi:hypothetical protein HYH03_007035 [Edaphochlamys debaryana]|uniref:Uncharacterized protein n=1 Tax=Edaphochlamys debaryana TaxID=47281 RepID=A0A835Y1D0_9CHLO|nr:hypothetical protein HYH03_007035 [Edaphochlamys debaryana]|eukprot:KAG2494792.1 hypothetical protein HYH03_007035 [Edaphochlamys debaryana]
MTALDATRRLCLARGPQWQRCCDPYDEALPALARLLRNADQEVALSLAARPKELAARGVSAETKPVLLLVSGALSIIGDLGRADADRVNWVMAQLGQGVEGALWAAPWGRTAAELQVWVQELRPGLLQHSPPWRALAAAADADEEAASESGAAADAEPGALMVLRAAVTGLLLLHGIPSAALEPWGGEGQGPEPLACAGVALLRVSLELRRVDQELRANALPRRTPVLTFLPALPPALLHFVVCHGPTDPLGGGSEGLSSASAQPHTERYSAAHLRALEDLPAPRMGLALTTAELLRTIAEVNFDGQEAPSAAEARTRNGALHFVALSSAALHRVCRRAAPFDEASSAGDEEGVDGEGVAALLAGAEGDAAAAASSSRVFAGLAEAGGTERLWAAAEAAQGRQGDSDDEDFFGPGSQPGSSKATPDGSAGQPSQPGQGLNLGGPTVEAAATAIGGAREAQLGPGPGLGPGPSSRSCGKRCHLFDALFWAFPPGSSSAPNGASGQSGRPVAAAATGGGGPACKQDQGGAAESTRRPEERGGGAEEAEDPVQRLLPWLAWLARRGMMEVPGVSVALQGPIAQFLDLTLAKAEDLLANDQCCRDEQALARKCGEIRQVVYKNNFGALREERDYFASRPSLRARCDALLDGTLPVRAYKELAEELKPGLLGAQPGTWGRVLQDRELKALDGMAAEVSRLALLGLVALHAAGRMPDNAPHQSHALCLSFCAAAGWELLAAAKEQGLTALAAQRAPEWGHGVNEGKGASSSSSAPPPLAAAYPLEPGPRLHPVRSAAFAVNLLSFMPSLLTLQPKPTWTCYPGPGPRLATPDAAASSSRQSSPEAQRWYARCLAHTLSALRRTPFQLAMLFRCMVAGSFFHLESAASSSPGAQQSLQVRNARETHRQAVRSLALLAIESLPEPARQQLLKQSGYGPTAAAITAAAPGAATSPPLTAGAGVAASSVSSSGDGTAERARVVERDAAGAGSSRDVEAAGPAGAGGDVLDPAAPPVPCYGPGAGRDVERLLALLRVGLCTPAARTKRLPPLTTPLPATSVEVEGAVYSTLMLFVLGALSQAECDTPGSFPFALAFVPELVGGGDAVAAAAAAALGAGSAVGSRCGTSGDASSSRVLLRDIQVGVLPHHMGPLKGKYAWKTINILTPRITASSCTPKHMQKHLGVLREALFAKQLGIAWVIGEGTHCIQAALLLAIQVRSELLAKGRDCFMVVSNLVVIKANALTKERHREDAAARGESWKEPPNFEGMGSKAINDMDNLAVAICNWRDRAEILRASARPAAKWDLQQAEKAALAAEERLIDKLSSRSSPVREALQVEISLVECRPGRSTQPLLPGTASSAQARASTLAVAKAAGLTRTVKR